MKKKKKFKSRDFEEVEKENRNIKSKPQKRHKRLSPESTEKWSKKDYYRALDEEE